METMLMVVLFISVLLTVAAVALSSYDDGPDGFSSA
jgi:hypothetical protein